MLFYCPNCREEKEVEPASTTTTLTGRIAYKGNCPVCGQDMAEFISDSNQTTPKETLSQDPAQS